MLHHRSRTRLIVAMAIVALASVVFGWSSAPAGGLASTVTITFSAGQFAGDVAAESPCQAGRSVTVTKVGKAAAVGTATTDGAGHWTLTKKRAHGKFSATVAASTVPGDGYGYGGASCDAGTSQTIQVKRTHRGGGNGGGGGGGGGNLSNLIERLNRLFDRLFPGL